jgi:hypothetical protein
MAPCRYYVNRRFGGTYRLHLQGIKIRERRTSVSRWLQTENIFFVFLKRYAKMATMYAYKASYSLTFRTQMVKTNQSIITFRFNCLFRFPLGAVSSGRLGCRFSSHEWSSFLTCFGITVTFDPRVGCSLFFWQTSISVIITEPHIRVWMSFSLLMSLFSRRKSHI